MIIPHAKLDAETLTNLIEEFVTREGTEYGSADYSLESKVKQVVRQLDRGEASIVFDADSGTCHIQLNEHLTLKHD